MRAGAGEAGDLAGSSHGERGKKTRAETQRRREIKSRLLVLCFRPSLNENGEKREGWVGCFGEVGWVGWVGWVVYFNAKEQRARRGGALHNAKIAHAASPSLMRKCIRYQYLEKFWMDIA